MVVVGILARKNQNLNLNAVSGNNIFMKIMRNEWNNIAIDLLLA